MGAHAFLAPSFAPVWAYCAAAPGVAASCPPQPDTQDTLNGEAVHWLIEQVLSVSFASPWQFIGQTAPNGVVIDGQMCEGAEVFINDVHSVLEGYRGAGELCVERRVQASSIHPTLNWGTYDCAYILRHQTSGALYKIYLWDYKNGHSEVRNFYQLVNYVTGIADEDHLPGDQELSVLVSLRIVQPFAYRAGGPVKQWDGTLAELRGQSNVLRNQAEEATGPSPTATPGAHCRYCPGNLRCTSSKALGYSLADLARQPYALEDMPVNALATERQIIKDALEGVKGRLEAIEETLSEAIKNGHPVKGLTLQAAFGREEWTVPPAVVRMVGAQFNVDLSKEAVKTPAQSRSMLKGDAKKKFIEAIKQFTTRPPKGVTLADADDSRTAKAFKPNK